MCGPGVATRISALGLGGWGGGGRNKEGGRKGEMGLCPYKWAQGKTARDPMPQTAQTGAGQVADALEA